MSKQRISTWIVEAISIAYEAHGLATPLGIRAHSTRAVASSKALSKGVSLQDVCVAAGWSTPHTVIRYHSLDIHSTPGSKCLAVTLVLGYF